MNIILNDTELVLTCSKVGFYKIAKNKGNLLWLSQFTLLDFSNYENSKLESTIENKDINLYHFSKTEIEQIYNRYNEFSDNISFSDASALVMANKIEDSIIINNNGVLGKIGKKFKIKCYDYNWFIEQIIIK